MCVCVCVCVCMCVCVCVRARARVRVGSDDRPAEEARTPITCDCTKGTFFFSFFPHKRQRLSLVIAQKAPILKSTLYSDFIRYTH
jgi:hypothetical protein